MKSELKDMLELQMWDSDFWGKCGGLAQLAGLDRTDVMPTTLDYHDKHIVNKRIRLDKLGDGFIERCIIHPRGRLLFDVIFDEHRLNFNVEDDGSIEWCDYIEEITNYHRFLGSVLVQLNMKFI